MQLTISGKNISVGESLRTHVKDTLEAVSKRYFSDPIEATVILSKEALHFRSDMSVHVGRGLVIRCHAHDNDPYQCIDGATQKLDKILRRHKNRLRDHHRVDQHTLEEALEVKQSVVSADQSNESDGASNPIIIAEMTTNITPMTVCEAIMRLDVSDHAFSLFKNTANGQINVVFRRPDGNIGWIDPNLKG
jgi:ribosomal subunit interface protein